MLKYIKHHAEAIAGIEVYPIISLVIFFLFFMILLIWVFRSSKQELDEIARLPLEKDFTTTETDKS